MGDFTNIVSEEQGPAAVCFGTCAQNKGEDDVNSIRQSLGLPPIEEDRTGDSSSNPNEVPKHPNKKELLESAFRYCEDRLGEVALRLFGCDGDKEPVSEKLRGSVEVYVHSETDKPLLSKKMRGRREQVVQDEIDKVVQEFALKYFTMNDSTTNEGDAMALSDKDVRWIVRNVSDRLLRKAFFEASARGARADGREGCNVVRPVSVTVPALPGSVHGSALFSRGDTRVLCTVTLGPPRDGLAVSSSDPYRPHTNPKAIPQQSNSAGSSSSGYESLPVGSLRLLRTQEHMMSDLNSRRVQADKEMTGKPKMGVYCLRFTEV
jgi:hypothetical protein